jgi:ComF family protein
MWVGQRIVCGRCSGETPVFEEGLFGFYYEERLRDAMHSFKFSGRKDVCKGLTGLIQQKIISFSWKFDCIIPLPVTEKRLEERGFNQSFIIAEEISGMTNKPVLHRVLQKVKETKDQYTLSRDERKRNIKGAFSITDGAEVRGKKVLLVDDLYTTGHTAREAARILKKGKVKTVVFFALARTP